MMNAVRDAFDRAADYDRHAIVQRRAAARLAERISALPLPPAPRILEVGCGTGLLGTTLVPLLPDANWLMTDIAPAMAARTHARFAGKPNIRVAVMDGEAPDVAGPFDLICSSLAAQWFTDQPNALQRLTGLLAPGGWLAITTLAEGSFAEWHAAHATVGAEAGTITYPPADALPGEVIIESIVAEHRDAREFLHALKAIGAGTPRAGHHPLPPATLRAVMHAFEAGGARVTYRIATCILRQPATAR